MRHLGITIEHAAADHICIKQTMFKRGDKLIQDLFEQLIITYDQAYDLKEQLIDFLDSYEPGV